MYNVCAWYANGECVKFQIIANIVYEMYCLNQLNRTKGGVY